MRKLFLITFLTLIGTIFDLQGAVIEEYILPADHPWQKKLSGLFGQVSFDSKFATRDGGFIPMKRAHRGMMTMHHPNAEGLLFKKFLTGSSSAEEERDNFIRRIEGARRLQALIDKHKLKTIIVPEKWLIPLEEEGRYILVVQKMDLLSENQSVQKYQKISRPMLGELCLVLNHLRGLDSRIHNMPFTHQNKIAFIDTERWEQFRPEFLRHAMKHLSSQNQDYAKSLKDF